MYVRASDVASRYTAFLSSFQAWAAAADQIYSDSAQETGGSANIRFVHNSACTINVLNVAVSATGDDSFDNTVAELRAAGYNRTDRKYMLFVDANVYCGIGGIWQDDQAGSVNANNTGPSYGRSDNGCWDGEVAAHEHMHNLGGVQLSAPNTSGGWHCVDEWDRMCYSDTPNFPPMRTVCADSTHDRLFDCNHDDYFSTSPPAGSYLATHWNTANNQFLTTGLTPPPCPDAAFEPDDTQTQARAVAVGSTERHAFCANADEDWIRFTAAGGTAYTLETLNLAAGVDTVLDLYDANGSLIASNDDTNGTLASLVTFTPSTGGAYFVRSHNFNSAGSVAYTYDLRVTAGGTANLLRNASFEIDANGDGRPDSWTSNAKFTRSSTIVFAGSFAGRHRSTDNSGHTISQTVSSLTAGRTYTLSGQVNIPPTTDAFTYRVQVKWRNSSNAVLRTDTVKIYSAATSGWNLASKAMVAPAGTTNAQVRLVAANLNATIYVDNLSLG